MMLGLSKEQWVFLITVLLIGLIATLPAQQDEPPVVFSDDHVWLAVTHESGIDYIVRTKHIIGFASPVPGDPKKRNGIMLSNGTHILTELDLDEFEDILEERPETRILKEGDLKK